MAITYMSKEGYDKLLKEIAHLESVERPRIINAISEARDKGGTQRNNVEFTKSGRIINAGIIYSVQRKSITVLYSHVEPAHRLLCLGKLII